MSSNPQRKLTLERRWPVVWPAVVLVLALLLPHRIWTTLLVGLGGLLLVSYVWARLLLNHLHATRRLRFVWVSVGDRLSEQFQLANHSPLPAFWVEIVDHSNLPGYRPGIVRSAGNNQTLSWRQSAVCEQRGAFHLGPWELHSADPFGIFQIHISYPISDEIIIHPPLTTQIPLTLPPGRSSGRTRATDKSWLASLNAAGVRDYRPEDPMRWIHWPTSARRAELYVRQFDLDASGDIWLLLDMEKAAQVGSGPEGTEETVVLLAAALSGQARLAQRSIGLASYGQTPYVLPPGRGAGHEWSLLRNLALTRADGDTPLGRALHDLSHVARRGSAVVIITSRADADWLPALWHLAQQGIQSQVVLLERASFGANQHSAGLQEVVHKAGVRCHLIRQGDVRPPEAEGEARGYWKFKTTGTGKVVVVSRPDLIE